MRRMRGRHRQIGPPDEPSRPGGEFVDVDVLIDLDDVIRLHLDPDRFRGRRQEALVKVVPDVILFDVRVHARE